MSAVIENMRITKSNVELVRNTGITAYCAKQKEVHCVFRLSLVIMFILLFGQVNGNGTILSNTAVHNNNQIPLAPLAVAPAVGTIFSPTIETHNLNHPTILHIIQFYNQNFNIQPGNTVPIHVQKIVNWLTSEIWWVCSQWKAAIFIYWIMYIWRLNLLPSICFCGISSSPMLPFFSIWPTWRKWACATCAGHTALTPCWLPLVSVTRSA